MKIVFASPGHSFSQIARFKDSHCAPSWTFAHNPEDGSFAPVEAWLEKHVPKVGVVVVRAHPHVIFRHIRAVTFSLEAAGLPYVAFHLLPH